MKQELSFFIKKWFLVLFFFMLPGLYLGRKIFILVNAYYTERNLKRSIIVLSAENELLKKRIEEYKSGRFIEAKARNDLGMIKKDEKIYVILK
ncbi:MAG: septum formation initiator family protein [candidate division WOR-3 bacterium]